MDAESRCWRAGVLKPAEAHVELGGWLPKSLRAALRTLLRVEEAPGLGANLLRIRKGSFAKTFGVGDGSVITPGVHWLIVLDKVDRREVARRRAHAYAQERVISSFCASSEQAARHVAAAALSLTNASCQEASIWGVASSMKLSGLAGVLRLARTAGGGLPAAVSRSCSDALQSAGCVSMALLVQRLRAGGPEYLLSLRVKDVGPERASAICSLLIDT